MRDQLRNALSKLELQDERLEEIEKRNVELERELKLQERLNTNNLKELVMLRLQWDKRG
jgi:hypothetical protein